MCLCLCLSVPLSVCTVKFLVESAFKLNIFWNCVFSAFQYLFVYYHALSLHLYLSVCLSVCLSVRQYVSVLTLLSAYVYYLSVHMLFLFSTTPLNTLSPNSVLSVLYFVLIFFLCLIFDFCKHAAVERDAILELKSEISSIIKLIAHEYIQQYPVPSVVPTPTSVKKGITTGTLFFFVSSFLIKKNSIICMSVYFSACLSFYP